jgi:uncharacterized protein YbjQ (UPF0145 family)
MIIATSSTVAGMRVTKTLGTVRGNTVRARHIGKDILAVFKNIVGGEIEEYTKLMAESRDQAIDRMISDAEALGATAVLDVRFSTSFIAQSAAEILVYGTAVVLRDEEVGA